MSSSSKLIQDLILFYVKENYNHYLKENELEKIPENQIENVVDTIYTTKKEHLKGFLKESLKKMMGEEYIGDLALLNICNEIFNDDQLCINRLVYEIRNYQKEI
tara:strand:- start:5901 stop:6212 length:312 start_codon:yes stop_codon:yes gene_type:complete